MNKKNLFAFVIFISASCFNAVKSQDIISPGVVKIKADVIDSLNRISRIYSPLIIEDVNRKIVDSLFYDVAEACFRFRNNVTSRAYYPERSVIYFDAYPPDNGRYSIFVNNEWCYIDSDNSFVEYIAWEKFLLDVLFVDITLNDNLYSQPDANSAIIDIDYRNIYFQPLKVKGDWIYVDVFEGENVFMPINRGWIKWRDGNKMLLKTLYFSI